MPRAKIKEEAIERLTRSARGYQMGRLTFYDHEKTPELIYKLSLLKATEVEMYDCLGITEAAWYQWKARYPQIQAAIDAGRLPADANVIKRMYEKAMGYEHEAVEIVFDRETKEFYEHKYIKRYPPDTTAAMAFLSNRRKDKDTGWRNNVSVSDADGSNLGPVTINIIPVDVPSGN